MHRAIVGVLELKRDLVERLTFDTGHVVGQLKEPFPGDLGRAIKGEVTIGTREAREGKGLAAGDTEAPKVVEAKAEEEEDGYKEGNGKMLHVRTVRTLTTSMPRWQDITS